MLRHFQHCSYQLSTLLTSGFTGIFRSACTISLSNGDVLSKCSTSGDLTPGSFFPFWTCPPYQIHHQHCFIISSHPNLLSYFYCSKIKREIVTTLLFFPSPNSQLYKSPGTVISGSFHKIIFAHVIS